MKPDRYEVTAALAASWCALHGRTVSWLIWLAVLCVWTPPVDVDPTP